MCGLVTADTLKNIQIFLKTHGIVQWKPVLYLYKTQNQRNQSACDSLFDY